MKQQSNPFSFSLSNLSSEQKERLIELITEIRSEVQYLILIIAKHPTADVVCEVKRLLSVIQFKNKEGNKQ